MGPRHTATCNPLASDPVLWGEAKERSSVKGDFLDERALVERARDGDGAALRSLYDAHVDRVFRVAHRMAGEEDLARDLTQDTFIRAFSRLHQFRGDSAFASWIHRICMSVVLNGLERHQRRRGRETDLDGAPDPTAAPVAGLEPDERHRLRKAVDGLPEAQRIVVVLHDLEGFTHREIAEALDVAEGTSKARLARARKKLREELTDLDPRGDQRHEAGRAGSGEAR